MGGGTAGEAVGWQQVQGWVWVVETAPVRERGGVGGTPRGIGDNEIAGEAIAKDACGD